ncbi:uncharacterized protein TNCV_2913811 [Trichonephila clavipes]|nr:uncharacterized protein TNCV_2913811 [Trichonephila clavipes]
MILNLILWNNGGCCTIMEPELGSLHPACGYSENDVPAQAFQRFQDDVNASKRCSAGRPRVTTPNEDRYLAIAAKRSLQSTTSDLLRQLSATTGTAVSKQTVYRYIWDMLVYISHTQSAALRTILSGPVMVVPEEIAEWYRHRIVAGFVTSSSPVPLKTRRVGQRCTLNLSRAETSSRWCGVVVRRGGASSGVVHVT